MCIYLCVYVCSACCILIWGWSVKIGYNMYTIGGDTSISFGGGGEGGGGIIIIKIINYSQ